MVTPAAGAVVLVRFPFSDLSRAKLRPAVVLAPASFNDWILCQITSNAYADPHAIPLSNQDFVHGNLRRESFARPAKLFTASPRLMTTQVGELTQAKFDEVTIAVTERFRGSGSKANPYMGFVGDFARLVKVAKAFPLGGFPSADRPAIAPDAPRALFFAPHPDDETIVGAMALRILREARMNLINVAVTQGSKRERQAERLAELKNACNYIGYGLQTTVPSGLEKVTARTRQHEPPLWAGMVKVIADILAKHNPRVILFPHERDWNSTHIGVHYLVMDALKQMPASFECFLIETEFWGAMDDPNLMVEVSAEDLADLITATTFHVGEVKRNPYHLLLPAWMMDNVRRGAELVGGQGGAAPDFTFAALYRLRQWAQGRVANVLTGGKFLSQTQNAGELFP